METINRFTGNPLPEGSKELDLRKMCLNCSFLKENEKGELVCSNQDNMKAAMEPVYDALNKVNGYNLVTLEVEPVPLKKPTNRCGNWALSDEVIEYMKGLFV